MNASPNIVDPDPDGVRAVADALLGLLAGLSAGGLFVWFGAWALKDVYPVLDVLLVPAVLHGLALGEVVLLFAGIRVVHSRDKRGTGLRGRYRALAGLNVPRDSASGDDVPFKLAADFLDADKGAIRAFVTKQSIFAALALALLGAVAVDRLPEIKADPLSLPVVCYWLAVVALLLSLVTVLVSIECYSSFLRYRWPYPENADLLIKGRTLDGLSFYLLVAGLMLGITAEYPWLTLLIAPVFTALLVHRYYFRSAPGDCAPGPIKGLGWIADQGRR